MQERDFNRWQLYARMLTAGGMFALAAALIYFTYELARIARHVPAVVQSVDRTIAKVDPVIREVGEITALVPPVLEEVRQTREIMRPAIDEYAKTNAQLPRILEEYAATRAMLPELLPGLLKSADNLSYAVVTVTKEVGANRELLPKMQMTADKTADALVILAEQVEASQPLLPDMLETTDHASRAVIILSDQIEAVRPLIPDILAEVEKTRTAIPPMLDDANRLVASARQAGKEASQGATSGFLSGLLMAPFVFVGDVGKALIGSGGKVAERMTETDFDMIEAAAGELLVQGEEGQQKKWQNPDSGNSGTVKLTRIRYESDGVTECRVLRFEVRDRKETLGSSTRDLCKNENGEWDFNR